MGAAKTVVVHPNSLGILVVHVIIMMWGWPKNKAIKLKAA